MSTWRSLALLPALLVPTALAGDPQPAPAAPAVTPDGGAAKPDAAKKRLRQLLGGGCPIEEVKPEPCPEKKKPSSGLPGVDPVEKASKPDPRLAAAWKLQAMGAETPATGTLEIDSAGRFTWTRDGKEISQGELSEVRPRIGAAEGTRYWKIRDGSDDFYVALEGAGLKVYLAATNSAVATATRK